MDQIFDKYMMITQSTFASEIHDLALSRAASKLYKNCECIWKLFTFHSFKAHDKICMNAVVGDGWVSSGGMCVEKNRSTDRNYKCCWWWCWFECGKRMKCEQERDRERKKIVIMKKF